MAEAALRRVEPVRTSGPGGDGDHDVRHRAQPRPRRAGHEDGAHAAGARRLQRRRARTASPSWRRSRRAGRPCAGAPLPRGPRRRGPPPLPRRGTPRPRRPPSRPGCGRDPTPNVGGHSAASSTPRRPLVPAPRNTTRPPPCSASAARSAARAMAARWRGRRHQRPPVLVQEKRDHARTWRACPAARCAGCGSRWGGASGATAPEAGRVHLFTLSTTFARMRLRVADHRRLVQGEDLAVPHHHSALDDDVADVGPLGHVHEMGGGVVHRMEAGRGQGDDHDVRALARPRASRGDPPSRERAPRPGSPSRARRGRGRRWGRRSRVWPASPPSPSPRTCRGRCCWPRRPCPGPAGSLPRAWPPPAPPPRRASCCSAGSGRCPRRPPSGSRGRSPRARRRARRGRPCAGSRGRAGARSRSCRSAP